MSSRATTAERVEFVRRMQQLYPDFDVTDACNYIMAKAATWIGCVEADAWWQRNFKRAADESTQTKRQLCKQRIQRRATIAFPNSPVVFYPEAMFVTIRLRAGEYAIPVPTSKRRRKPNERKD